jgi:zinc D-Ala-D-Ala carboxypeptidase
MKSRKSEPFIPKPRKNSRFKYLSISIFTAGVIAFAGTLLERQIAASRVISAAAQAPAPAAVTPGPAASVPVPTSPTLNFQQPDNLPSQAVVKSAAAQQASQATATGTDAGFDMPAFSSPQRPQTVSAPKSFYQAKASAVQPLYGHFPYEEASSSRIESVGEYARDDFARSESMDYEAAEVFRQMQAAAKAEGISLMPISGFRTIEVQASLWERQIGRQGSKEAAARLSAPPGHSEHHTGYVLDIADGNYPDDDLKVSFDQTPAFRWLSTNAAKYGFELSFPPNNAQGVSYEPWHWRYIGSDRAQKIFAVAKSMSR